MQKADVCKAAASEETGSVTANSDVIARWLAAQEVFNALNLERSFFEFLRYTSGLQLVMDGVRYQGFEVTYADGAKERWAINPGYATSSVKLIDHPFPNSLQPLAKPKPGCKRIG